MSTQFDAAEAMLKDIQAETSTVRKIAEDQKAKVEEITKEVDAAVQEMRQGENQTRDEMREIRQEVDTIQEMLPKVRFFNSTLPSFYLCDDRCWRRIKKARHRALPNSSRS